VGINYLLNGKNEYYQRGNTMNRGYWGYQELSNFECGEVVGAGCGGCGGGGGCGGAGGEGSEGASDSSSPSSVDGDAIATTVGDATAAIANCVCVDSIPVALIPKGNLDIISVPSAIEFSGTTEIFDESWFNRLKAVK
jgi:hypothetical protein